MATLHPFRALRPAPAAAPAVAAVPYDVINADEARTLAAGKPLSFLHVSRAELGLTASTDPYSDVVYDTAKQNFDRLKSAAPLVVDDAPSVYFYRLRMGSHVQTGLAACYSIDEYEGDVILKHAVRNAMIAPFTVIMLQINYLVAGVVVVESVFSYPGLGRLLIFAIERHDLPLIQASILVIAAIYCFANLVADLLYAYFNPKIRYGGTRS